MGGKFRMRLQRAGGLRHRELGKETMGAFHFAAIVRQSDFLLCWTRFFLSALLLGGIGGAALSYGGQDALPARNSKSTIPAPEFSRMVREFSEPGGVFPTDNFTSNERSYLHIVERIRTMRISGGAYIGVGPEQNFTYIAKIRPRIAFIVDIRRQAVLQHLLYKAIFHLAKNRAQFLALLFSRPAPQPLPRKGDQLQFLLDNIRAAPTSEEAYLSNLVVIRKTLEEDFRFPLSASDLETIGYIYRAFWRDNLGIGFSFGRGQFPSGSFGFPTLGNLILATDLQGKRGNFLAREEDYQIVRKLQEQNRVIPVVGDFGGAKALRAVADYLHRNHYTVSAFYTSNVEEYLYENNVFGAFAANTAMLPISGRSVFIRAVRAGWAPHSFWVPSDRITPFLQRISDFLDDYRKGLLPNYGRLVSSHAIPPGEPHAEYLPVLRQ